MKLTNKILFSIKTFFDKLTSLFKKVALLDFENWANDFLIVSKVSHFFMNLLYIGLEELMKKFIQLAILVLLQTNTGIFFIFQIILFFTLHPNQK